MNHLFHFFEQSIKESRRPLFEQYEDALARFPNAQPLDIAILQTVLILSVITNSEMAPTTSFLAFCLADVLSEEAAANEVQESLRRLADAHSLWKNEATEVWGFGGERGLSSGIDKLLEQELAEIPVSLSALELVRRYPHIQQELTDRLGDHDLDPAESGVVRSFTVEILDSSKGDKAVDTGSSVGEDGSGTWRSARVYLVGEESQAQLDAWKTRAASLSHGFGVPRARMGKIDSGDLTRQRNDDLSNGRRRRRRCRVHDDCRSGWQSYRNACRSNLKGPLIGKSTTPRHCGRSATCARSAGRPLTY